jgi:hypothetical protein
MRWKAVVAKVAAEDIAAAAAMIEGLKSRRSRWMKPRINPMTVTPDRIYSNKTVTASWRSMLARVNIHQVQPAARMG